jgi:hypothetical protein
MFEREREVLQAIGIQTAKMTPLDVYDMSCKVTRDKELTDLAVAECAGSSVVPVGTRLEIIRSMPAAERLRLRERLTGVLSFGGK